MQQPYESSVLAPRTKWRAIVSSKVGPGDANMRNNTNNHESNIERRNIATPGHDALLSGLFRGSNTRRTVRNDNGRNQRQDPSDEDANTPEDKPRRFYTW